MVATQVDSWRQHRDLSQYKVIDHPVKSSVDEGNQKDDQWDDEEEEGDGPDVALDQQWWLSSHVLF